MALPTRKLEDLIEALIDYRGRTPTKTQSGVRLITAKVIKGGRITDTSFEYIAEDDYVSVMRRGIPRQGDILITTEAPMGEVAQLRMVEPIALAQRVILLRSNPAVMDQAYMFYALQSPFVQAELAKRATGTTVLGIKQRELRKIEIPWYPLSTQRRVGSLLSAYGELIENNTRRIVILEQMARALYREWFVEFRHPEGAGSEGGVARRKGVRAGWRHGKLSNFVTLSKGKSYRGSELVESGGLPFVNLKCFVRDGGFRRDGLKCFLGEYRADHCVGWGDIIMAVTDMTQERRIIARAARMPRISAPHALMSLDVVKLAPNEPEEVEYFYAMLRFSGFSDEIKQHANGANVLHLNPARILDYVADHPPLDIAKQFSAVLRPMLDMSDVLAAQTEKLKATRDLLLPRLISGELDVSRLPDPGA